MDPLFFWKVNSLPQAKKIPFRCLEISVDRLRPQPTLGVTSFQPTVIFTTSYFVKTHAGDFLKNNYGISHQNGDNKQTAGFNPDGFVFLSAPLC